MEVLHGTSLDSAKIIMLNGFDAVCGPVFTTSSYEKALYYAAKAAYLLRERRAAIVRVVIPDWTEPWDTYEKIYKTLPAHTTPESIEEVDVGSLSDLIFLRSYNETPEH